MTKARPIGFRDEDKILSELAQRLADPDRPPRCVDLVLPPGFGEHAVAERIARLLYDRESPPAVALVAADLEGPQQFLAQLRHQWGQAQVLPETLPAEVQFSHLLDAIRGRRAILILTRFFHILGALGESILTTLRNAEQAHRLQTLVVTIYPLEWIKNAWRQRDDGHNPLLGSDYGDTHRTVEVRPLSAADVWASLADRGVPKDLARAACEWTGGYPEPLNAVIDEWEDLPTPRRLTPEVWLQLRAVAQRMLSPMARHLDLGEEARYRRMVLNVHDRCDAAMAYADLRAVHPWRDILLDGSGLRAECLGDAAAALEVQMAFAAGQQGDLLSLTITRAKEMYRRKQYDAASQLLKATHVLRPDVQVLKLHAHLMAAIYGGTEGASLDADWRRIGTMLAEAQNTLSRLTLDDRARERVVSRLQGLESLAGAIKTAASGGQRRILDVMAGDVAGCALEQKALAYQILILQYQVGRATSGASAAVRAVLSLPEQVFRLWAAWRIQISYDAVPEGYEEVWENIRHKCKSMEGPFQRPAKGDSFNSFRVFAYFCLAYCLRQGAVPGGELPAADLRELDQQLAIFDYRNDAAHSLVLMDDRLRQQYFSVLERWLAALAKACPECDLSIRRALSTVDALPLVDERGQLDLSVAT